MNRNMLLFNPYRSFTSNQNSDDSGPELPKVKPIDFEAPIDDTKDHELTIKFMKRFLLLIPFTLAILYKLFLVRVNPFSKQKEFGFVSESFEKSVLGPFLAKRIEKKIHGRIYKQDTDETKRCIDICDKIIKKNNLKPYLRDIKIKVVHLPIVGCFMNFDQSIYIPVKNLLIAENDDQLALLISREISHYLL